MHLYKVFLIIFSLFSSSVFSLGNSTYWQQHVEYDIDVKLDDKNQVLNGFVQMEYFNNSPDTLRQLLIHLWPNAYKDNNTPFARQQIKLGNTRFHYADESERGYIDRLNFIVDNKAAEWYIDSSNAELAIVKFDKALYPGASVKIGTPFRVKIPAPFSRFGHDKQQYQISQWYPKPVVYDKEGWHPMPYLDQGEFYSEFGDFNVRITLPANYVVAASGKLVSEDEVNWLEERSRDPDLLNEDSNEIPISDTLQKSISFEIENAHDFAWFADKRYLVSQDKIKLNGRDDSVLVQAFYLPEEKSTWSKATEISKRGLQFYNDLVGTYSYPTLSAVSGELEAGSGMEYPGITIIGETGDFNSLETVLVHEIGHNWFYGILGNNERDAPWLDESINSYYEQRYILENYPDRKIIDRFPRLVEFLGLNDFKYSYLNNLFYLFSARRNEDQPIGLHSEEFSSLNYGAMVYAKGAKAFQYLSGYLGEIHFDRIMQEYFKTFRFKHHSPDNFRMFFEKATGRDLSWFFDELIYSDKIIDFALKDVGRDSKHLIVKVKNKTGFTGPFPIQQYYKDSLLSENWIEGFKDEAGVMVKMHRASHIYIDRKKVIPEFNTQNNNFRIAGVANRLEKIRFQFLGSIDHPEKSELYYFPLFAWNNYDKSMLGLALYNHTLLNKKLQFELAPMFSAATHNFSGTGNVNYNWWPSKGNVREWKLGMSASRFSYLLFPVVQRFHKANPYLKIAFKKPEVHSPITVNLKIRSVNIWQDYLIPKNKNYHFYVNELALDLRNNNPLLPWKLNASFRQGKTFGTVQTTFNFDIPYRRGKEAVKVRLFAGGFLWSNRASGTISPPVPRLQLSGSTGSGSSALLPVQGDYLFDHVFLDRNGFDPVFGQQIVTKDGGFKSRTIVGDTDRFLSSIVVESTFPGKIPLKPYAGFSAFIDRKDEFGMAAELGVSFVILPEIFEIHFPIITTNNIKDNQETGSLSLDKYYEKITFTLNINKLNPFEQKQFISF